MNVFCWQRKVGENWTSQFDDKSMTNACHCSSLQNHSTLHAYYQDCGCLLRCCIVLIKRGSDLKCILITTLYHYEAFSIHRFFNSLVFLSFPFDTASLFSRRCSRTKFVPRIPWQFLKAKQLLLYPGFCSPAVQWSRWRN